MAFLRRHRLGAVLLILTIVVGGLVAFRLKNQQAQSVPRPQFEVVVGVAAPVLKDVEVKLAYTADVLPNKQVAIFSKVSGYIRRIGVERGDLVKPGQLLVEIEDDELQAAAEQARASVATAEANLRVAESNTVAARAAVLSQEANLVRAKAVQENDWRNYQRHQDLLDRGLISAMERDNARTAAESSKASLAAADAQLAVARSQVETQESQVHLARAQLDRERAALKIAQTNLDNARITAPFAGYISQRNLDPGASVNAQAAGTNIASVGILILQNIDTVKVQVEIQERDISLVGVGSTARVLVDAYPGKVFSAGATRAVHALDPRTRTMGLEMEIQNPNHLLKPGMYARVELLVTTHPGALLVPGEAVRFEDGGPVLYLVQDGTVVRRPVAVGVSEGTLVEVTQGLSGNEAVIVEGKELVRDGQKVRTVPVK
ncbi:MAG: efflux RND transporter periplasmic adaptor subunit [Candidatus Rokubacteria bacterium]|nr:efflux RND transporter periplasmic adaptor subunit [Candidatus Rokubacteria bacterium]